MPESILREETLDNAAERSKHEPQVDLADHSVHVTGSDVADPSVLAFPGPVTGSNFADPSVHVTGPNPTGFRANEDVCQVHPE